MLGRCPALDTPGSNANQTAETPADALASTLRWLIRTGNRKPALPDSLVRWTRLQKLMLAGNRLSRLSTGVGTLQRLESLRLSGNPVETAAAALPDGLLALPRRVWLAHAGHPFSQAHPQAAQVSQALHGIPGSALQLDKLLGEGASGQIHTARWQREAGTHPLVAVKLFKSDVTSDALPRSEMAACAVTSGAAAWHTDLARCMRPSPCTPWCALRVVDKQSPAFCGGVIAVGCAQWADVYQAFTSAGDSPIVAHARQRRARGCGPD